MLRTLKLAHFAIAREVSLDLERGLTVLTGETGAGKSILVDALGVILGARVTAEMVRSGARAARVEGIFRVDGEGEAADALADLGLEIEDGEVILGREVNAQGRGRALVNGSLNTLQNLKRVGGALAEIHGQHEHMSLANPATHLALLDAFAGLDEAGADLAALYARLKALEARLHTLASGERERARRVDTLSFQIREIDEAEPRPGEDDELLRERRVLENAERVYALAEESYQELYERDGAILGRLAEVAKQVAELASYESRFEGARQQLDGVRLGLEDAALALRDYARHLVFDAGRRTQVEERLAVLDRLKTKYGPGLAEVLAFALRAREELKDLVVSDDEMERLKRELDAARAAYVAAAQTLSERRAQAAKRLARRIEAELADLALEKARFSVRLSMADDPASAIEVGGRHVAWGPRGVDRAEFLLAPNPGEGLHPLHAIASGGELARVQLAIGGVTGAGHSAIAVVYDEVDAGISGRVGDAVGRKLKALSAGRQVLCVTHLPQVAAHADHHVVVRKLERSGRTEVEVEALDEGGRIEELARMLGGARVTEAARQHAADLVAQAVRS